MKRSIARLLVASSVFSCTFAGEPSGALVGFAAKRNWSDQSGKFRIEAQLKTADAKTIQLLKTDGLVVTVPLEKMSNGDRAFVEGFLIAEQALSKAKVPDSDQADNPFSGGTPSPTGAPAMVAETSKSIDAGQNSSNSGAMEKRQGIVNGFRPLSITPSREFWSAKPPLAFPGVQFEDAMIQTTLGKPFFASMRVLAAGKSGTVVLNAYQDKGHDSAAYGKFVVASAATLDVSPVFQFDSPWKLLAINADGSRFVAVRVVGFDKGNDLGVFRITDGQVVGEYEFTAGGGAWDELLWADFLPGDRLATISQKHTLTIWDLGNRVGPKALYRGTTGGASRADLTPAGELMAMVFGNSIGMIETTQCKLVGSINRDAPANQLAFSADGKTLAAFHPFTVTLYGTTDGKVMRTVAVSEANPGASMRWVGKHLLIGSVLYDVERGLPLWTYAGQPASQTSLGDYLIAGFGAEQSSVAVYRIPHEEALRAANEINPDTAYAIKPGDSVSVLYDLGAAPANTQKEIRDAVALKLKALGWKLDPKATSKVTVKLEQGKQEEAEYYTQEGFGRIPFFAPPGFGGRRPTGPAEKVTYTPWTHSLSIHAGEKQVYTSSLVRSAPQNLQTNDKESTQDAVTRICQPTASFFSNLGLPPFMLKAEYQGGLGKSTLDVNGLH